MESFRSTEGKSPDATARWAARFSRSSCRRSKPRPPQPSPKPTPLSSHLNCALQLAARSVDITSARTPNKRLHTSPHQDSLKIEDSFIGGSLECDSGTRVQRNQVDFCFNAANQFRQLASVLSGIVRVF